MYRTGQLKRKPYSRMWKYKEEVARFEKLQLQYLYLYRHSIRSAEELKDRKGDIRIRIDALDEERHRIYKRRYPYKPALELLKIIEENEMRASYYKEGSIFYASNYEKWKEAVDALSRKGYTVSQITEIKETFQGELSAVTKAKRELKKEENLVDDILAERSRVQVIEKTVTKSGLQEQIKETNAIQEEIFDKKRALQKGGDAEKAELTVTEIPTQTDTKYLENQSAHSEKQKYLEQIR